MVTVLWRAPRRKRLGDKARRLKTVSRDKRLTVNPLKRALDNIAENLLAKGIDTKYDTSEYIVSVIEKPDEFAKSLVKGAVDNFLELNDTREAVLYDIVTKMWPWGLAVTKKGELTLTREGAHYLLMELYRRTVRRGEEIYTDIHPDTDLVKYENGIKRFLDHVFTETAVKDQIPLKELWRVAVIVSANDIGADIKVIPVPRADFELQLDSFIPAQITVLKEGQEYYITTLPTPYYEVPQVGRVIEALEEIGDLRRMTVEVENLSDAHALDKAFREMFADDRGEPSVSLSETLSEYIYEASKDTISEVVSSPHIDTNNIKVHGNADIDVETEDGEQGGKKIVFTVKTPQWTDTVELEITPEAMLDYESDLTNYFSPLLSYAENETKLSREYERMLKQDIFWKLKEDKGWREVEKDGEHCIEKNNVILC